MGFFSKVVKAVTSPITGTVKSLGAFAKGDIAGGLAYGIEGAAGTDPFIASKLSKKLTGSLAGGAEVSTGDPATDFARQQYQDWLNTFGPVQDNLSAFYSNLTPDYYASRGIEAFNQERDTELNDLNSLISQTNVGADAAKELRKNENILAAQSKSQIRRYAGEAVANQQQQFLSIGMGSGAASNYQNALSNNSAFNQQQSAAASAANGQAAGSLIQVAGSLAQTGLNSYFGGS